jgi:protein-tyrosine phosphatase
VIDLHAHLLPAIDDGPPDLPGSLALARTAVDGGTRVMVATPHIGHVHGIAPASLAGHVADLTATLAAEGVPLEVVAGGELAPDRALDLTDEELAAIALGGSRCILLECPFTRAGDLMGRLVAHLQMKGFRVLLAHPERSPTFLGDPPALAELVRRGAYAQLTAGSLAGQFGRTVQRASLAFLAEGLVHVVASDAHDARLRPPVLGALVRARLEEEGQDPALADWLCEAAPAALLSDQPLPDAPPWRARRRWWRRAW